MFYKALSKALLQAQTGNLLLLTHSQSCRRKFERSDIIFSCQAHASHRSALHSAPSIPPFILQLLSPLQLFCQQVQVPSTDKTVCSLRDPPITPLIYLLHILIYIFLPPFPNILVLFYLLWQLTKVPNSLPLIIFHRSGCIPSFLLTAVPVFSPLPLVPQTTLWFLFFLLFQESPLLFLSSFLAIPANSNQQTKNSFYLICIRLCSTTENW